MQIVWNEMISNHIESFVTRTWYHRWSFLDQCKPFQMFRSRPCREILHCALPIRKDVGVQISGDVNTIIGLSNLVVSRYFLFSHCERSEAR